MNISQVLIKPVLSKKSVRNTAVNKYTFVVHKNATKVDIKNALANLYGVKIDSVNILKNLAKYRFGKRRALMQKRPETRRAIITLKAGEKLDLSKLAGDKAKKVKKASVKKVTKKHTPKKTTSKKDK